MVVTNMRYVDDDHNENDDQVDGTLSPVSMHAGHGMDTLDNDTTGRRKVIIMMVIMLKVQLAYSPFFNLQPLH